MSNNDKLVKRLIQIDGPNLHFIEGDRPLLNKFINELQKNIPTSTYLAVVDGNGVTNLDELFNRLSIAFEFPDYFGNNWNALDECINDLDWLNKDSYVLILESMDSMLKDEQNFNILIRILRDAARDWHNGRNYDSFPTPPTPFHIVFGVDLTKGSEIKRRLIAEGFKQMGEII